MAKCKEQVQIRKIKAFHEWAPRPPAPPNVIVMEGLFTGRKETEESKLAGAFHRGQSEMWGRFMDALKEVLNA